MEVVVQENESLERALRRFKRKVQRSGLYPELRKRRYYEKPSAQRKRKSAKPPSVASAGVSVAPAVDGFLAPSRDGPPFRGGPFFLIQAHAAYEQRLQVLPAFAFLGAQIRPGGTR